MNQLSVRPLQTPHSRPDAVSAAPEVTSRLQLLRSLKMHPYLAVSVFVVVAVSLFAYSLSLRPQYLASSVIYIQPATPKPLTDVSSSFYDSSRYESYIQQQLQTIVRDDILAAALKELPPAMWRHPGEDEESAIARLKSAIKTERVANSYEVTISLTGSDPASVTRIVNAVTDAFLKKGRGDELVQSDQQLASLSGDREQILRDLEKDRREQAALSTTLGVADTAGEGTGNPFDSQLQELRSQVISARVAHDNAVAQLAAASKGEMLGAASDEVAAADASLASLKVANTERRTALATQMAGMTPANPLYKKDQEELARLDEAQANLSQKLSRSASQVLVGKWRLEEARTAGVLSRLEGQLARQVATATGATPQLQRASDLAADIARLQARFTATDNAIHSLELLESSSGLVHLSLPATQPQQISQKRKRLVLAAALPLALFCGLFAAVAASKLDPRVYIAEDMGEVLHFPPMAVLPNAHEVDAPVMDEFLLRLVAGIDQAHRAGDAKTFVFTGASPGMRTSALVESLAERMNKIGYRVVVSKASAALKSLTEAGTSGPQQVEDQQTAEAPTEALVPLGSQSIVFKHLKDITRSVDILFIDALPILTSAEAEFDARLVDVTVLLAESGRTTKRELTRSLALIQRLTTAGVAAVLLNLRLKHADWEFLAAVRSPGTAG